MAQHRGARHRPRDRRLLGGEQGVAAGLLGAVKAQRPQAVAEQRLQRLQHAVAQHRFGGRLAARLQVLQAALGFLRQFAQRRADDEAVDAAQQRAEAGRQRVDAGQSQLQAAVLRRQAGRQRLAPVLVERVEVLVGGDSGVAVATLLGQAQRRGSHRIAGGIGLLGHRHRRHEGQAGDRAEVALAMLQRDAQHAAGIDDEGAEARRLVAGEGHRVEQAQLQQLHRIRQLGGLQQAFRGLRSQHLHHRGELVGKDGECRRLVGRERLTEQRQRLQVDVEGVAEAPLDVVLIGLHRQQLGLCQRRRAGGAGPRVKRLGGVEVAGQVAGLAQAQVELQGLRRRARTEQQCLLQQLHRQRVRGGGTRLVGAAQIQRQQATALIGIVDQRAALVQAFQHREQALLQRVGIAPGKQAPPGLQHQRGALIRRRELVGRLLHAIVQEAIASPCLQRRAVAEAVVLGQRQQQAGLQRRPQAGGGGGGVGIGQRHQFAQAEDLAKAGRLGQQ